MEEERRELLRTAPRKGSEPSMGGAEVGLVSDIRVVRNSNSMSTSLIKQLAPMTAE